MLIPAISNHLRHHILLSCILMSLYADTTQKDENGSRPYSKFDTPHFHHLQQPYSFLVSPVAIIPILAASGV